MEQSSVHPYDASMSCVLVGNYGAQNIGDEALREYFLSAFPDVAWRVVTALPSKPNEIPRLPFGVRSFFTPWFQTVGAIARADALVFGGGSLFTDIESVKACMIWGSYAFVAWVFRTPIILAFQGVGPFHTSFGRFLASWTAKRAAFISVRDEDSLSRVASWKTKFHPVLTFDPAFALFASHPKKSVASKTLVLIPRTNSNQTFFDAVSKKILEKFDAVHILLMQPDEEERRVGDRLKNLAGSSSVVVPIESVKQLLDEVSGASFVLSQRFHGALAALALNVPMDVVPQSERDKMWALRETLSNPSKTRDRFRASIHGGEERLKQTLKSLSSL